MSTPTILKKTIGNTRSATSVGIKDTMHHISKKLYSNGKKKKKDDYSILVSIKPSTQTMVGNMKKDLQKTKKPFVAKEFIIQNTEEKEDNSDISDSDSESGSAFFKWNATSSPPLERIS